MDYPEALAILGNPTSLAEAEHAARREHARWSNILRLPGGNQQRMEAQQRLREIETALETVRQRMPARPGAGFAPAGPLAGQSPQAPGGSGMPAPPPQSSPSLGRRLADAVAGGLLGTFGVLLPRVQARFSTASAWSATHRKVALAGLMVLLAAPFIVYYALPAWRAHGTHQPQTSIPQAPAPQFHEVPSAQVPHDVSQMPSTSPMQPTIPQPPRLADAVGPQGYLSIRVWRWGYATIDGHRHEIPTHAPIPLCPGEYAITVSTGSSGMTETVTVRIAADQETVLLKPKNQTWQSRTQRR